MSANVTAQVGCAGGSNGEIMAMGQNGIAPYTYMWSNNQTTATATNLSAGMYMITVTDSIGCATVAQLSIQDPPTMTLSATGTDLNCNGDNSGMVSTAVAGGVPNYSYQWSNGSTTAQLNNAAAGTYTVSVTDAYGCVLTETV